VKIKLDGKSFTVTEKQKKLGADALKQKTEEGENPPSWVQDEDIWQRAKEAANKSYDESDDFYWAAVTSIYENMGGEVGAIDSTPSHSVKSGTSDGVKKSWEKRRALSYSEKSESASAHSKLADKASVKAEEDATEASHREAAQAHLTAMDKHGVAHDYAAEANRATHLDEAARHDAAMKDHLRKADAAHRKSVDAQDEEMTASNRRKGKSVRAERMLASVPVGQLSSLVTTAVLGDSRFDHNLIPRYQGDYVQKPYCQDILMPETDGGKMIAVIRTDTGETVKIPFEFDGKTVTISKGEPVPTTGVWLYTRGVEEKRIVHSRSSSTELSTDPPKEFMWMPGGVSTIEATCDGKPIRMTVECDADTAKTVTASLQRWRERYPKQKPFVCVEHREEEAAGWPETFSWKDEPEPGVFCSVESWSELGERNVKGRIHRSFSPSFSTDADYGSAQEDAEGVLFFPEGVRGSESNPAQVTGVAFSIGSLTNKPAFRNILPVRAKQADPAACNTNQNAENRTMKIKLTKARGTNAAGAVLDLPEVEAAKAINEGDALDVRAAEAIEASANAKAEVRKMHEGMIDAAIKSAKERKAIEPANEDVRAKCIKWLDKSGDIEMVTEFVNGLPVKAAAATSTLTQRQTTSDGNIVRSGISDMRPGLEEGCREFCRARTPMNDLIRAGNFKAAFEISLETSAILSSHVKPILASGGDFRMKDVIRAADVTDGNLGTLSTGLLLMRNLGFLKAKLSWLPYVSTDLRNEPALFNQPVFTRYITPPAVTSFNTTTGWAASTALATDRTVTMDQHKGVEIRFHTQMLGTTIRNLFAEQKAAQFYSLAETINTFFIGKITGATWTPTLADNTTAVGPVVSALADWDIKSLVKVKNKLTLARIPDMGRFVLLHSTYHDKLLEDSNLVLARTIQSALNAGESDALTEGTLPTLFGIKPLESQLMTDDATYDGESSGTPTKIGFAGNASAMLFVARIPQDYTQVFTDIPSTAAIEIITEPDSGLSMLYVRYVNHQLANVSARCSLMYGAAQGDPRTGFFIQRVA